MSQVGAPAPRVLNNGLLRRWRKLWKVQVVSRACRARDSVFRAWPPFSQFCRQQLGAGGLGIFFFFSPSGLRLSVEWALSLPFLGVGESLFLLSFHFLRVEDKGKVKVNWVKNFVPSFPLLLLVFVVIITVEL